MPELILNGKPHFFSDGATLLDLVQALGLTPDFLVAEVNGGVVRAVDFSTYRLAPKDTLELIQFVGGG